jgi:hypothetical protein
MRYQVGRQYDNEVLTHIWRKRERSIKFMYSAAHQIATDFALSPQRHDSVSLFFTHSLRNA